MRFRIASIAAICAIAIAAQLCGWLRPLDDALSDSRFSFARRAATGSIAIVDIDARSLAAIGRWPLARRLYGDAIDRLVGLGAAEIALDIDFSAASTPEDDTAMAAALARAGDTVILAAFDQPSSAGGTIIHNRPIAGLAEYAWLAGVNVLLDPDGKVRRLAYGSGTDSDPMPSLAALYGGGSARSGQAFRIDFGIDAAGIDRLSLIDVLNGKVDRSRIAGKKIIVGAQAVELRDQFLVPRYGVVSGSLLQALGAEAIAGGRAISRTNDVVTVAGLLALAVLAFLLWRRRWQMRLACIGGLGLTIEATAIVVQRQWPLEVATGAWQLMLVGLAVLALLREIDFRRILIMISRSETRNTQSILARVVADSYAGVLIFGTCGTVVAASRNAATILGRSGELVGSGEGILPAELAAAVTRTREAAGSGTNPEAANGEIAWRRGGDDVIVEYVATPSRLDGGVDRDGAKRPDTHVVCLTFMDVTERRRATERIAYLARFDTLTGLANRNRLAEGLDQALDRFRTTGERSAVVALDVDRFGTVNDTLGPLVGDRLLKAIADRLREVTRAEDLAGRLSGDDFAVILSGGDAVARAEALAGRLIAGAAGPYELAPHRLVVGMSAGIAITEGDETDPLVVLQRAETARRRAKAGGGNAVVVFDRAMAAGLAAAQVLEQELWKAHERGEFEVFYQPAVELATGAITGCEALLRWRHPVRGLVGPAEFIPVLEAIGLMPAVGRWVLETAAGAATAWPPHIGVAVNVSSMQFMRGNLLEAVGDVLRDTGLPPARLTLEITESLFMGATPAVRATMDALVAIGVHFALDDFGTGYSSLAYLRNFPVSTIKIDRSFVVGLPASEQAVAIVRAISVLAESLRMRVVAEGIETIDQVRFLRLLGCATGQGYLYGAAMPRHEFAALLEDQSERRAVS